MNETRRRIERLHAEILTAALEHSAAHAAAIASFGEQVAAAYTKLVDDLIVELRGDAATASWAEPALDALRGYLAWLQWTNWNVASLAPVAGNDAAGTAALTASATLAYNAGRLIDDGIDDHRDYKGSRPTFRALLEQLDLHDATGSARPLSVFLGLCAFQHALRSMRRRGQNGALASFVERRFARVSSGVLAELCAPGAPDKRAYDSIVWRKSVNYNMILYGPLVGCVAPSHRFATLRALGGIDHLAQVVNDYGDRSEDRARARLNCFSSAIITDPESYLASALAEIANRIARLPPVLSGALSVMLANAKPLRLLPPAPAGAANGRAPTAPALRHALERGIARLRSLQSASGEFATYYSREPSMTGPVYVRSPFVSGMVALALQRWQARAELRSAATSALGFALAARRSDGTIPFLSSGIDPDLDDTCLLNALLQERRIGGFDYAGLARRIAALPTSGGLYPTWLRGGARAENDVDPVVSVNVVRFLAQNGIDCRATAAGVRRAFTTGLLDAGSLYYTSWAALPYFAGSLLPWVRRSFENDVEWNAKLAHMLEERVSVEAPPAETAMALSAASTARTPASVTNRLAAIMLRAQLPSGGWPACAVFRAFNYWGSEALSTALALDALLLFASSRHDGA